MAIRRLEVRPMEPADADACAGLWSSRFRRLMGVDDAAPVPTTWLTEPSRVRRFIAERVDAGLTLTAGGDIAGYLVADRGRFHGRTAAFCPVLSHSVVPEHCEWGYRMLYREASAAWVGDGILDHYITIMDGDRGAMALFFDLGFGRYVIDAYRRATPLHTAAPADCRVRRVGVEALTEVRSLMDLAVAFFREAPLFLVQQPDSSETLRKLLEDDANAVFIAEVAGTPVGVMNARRSDTADPISLCDRKTGRLDPLGAFIRREYRNRGIGETLLRACIEWCIESGTEVLHVDYEGANLYAAGFWIKHFHPALVSLKRSIHPDIVQPQAD